MNNNRLDLVEFIINEINNKYSDKFIKEKNFMIFNKNVCNDALYQNAKYKESSIILTNIFRNLMMDFCKEVNDYVNEEGVYKDE